MPAIIAWVANSWIGRLVVGVVIDRLAGFVREKLAERAQRQEIKKQAQQSVEPLKKAQTAAEIDAAADEALNHV